MQQKAERDGLCLSSAVPKIQWLSILTSSKATRLFRDLYLFHLYEILHGPQMLV